MTRDGAGPRHDVFVVGGGAAPYDDRLADLEPKFTCLVCGIGVLVSGRVLTRRMGYKRGNEKSGNRPGDRHDCFDVGDRRIEEDCIDLLFKK